MNVPSMSIATLGLSTVEESLVKSLLRVLDGRTSATWHHSDDFDADVVICVPDNSLASLARKREKENGRPLCIAVAGRGKHPDDWNRRLHLPLRLHEFLDVLETACSEFQDARSGRGTAEQVTGPRTPCAQVRRNSLVAELRALHQAPGKSPRAVLIRAGTQEMAVLMPQGRCHLKGGFTDASFAELMLVRGEVEVMPLPDDAEHEQLLSESWIWLDTLLWRLGLLGRAEADLGSDPDNAAYGLECWPDFGKIPSNPLHIKLTALLSKREMGIAAAAELLQADPADVRAFLRACACCGLLGVTEAQYVVVPKRVLRSSFGLFNFVRSALGMRV